MFIATFDISERESQVLEFFGKNKNSQVIIFNVKKKEPNTLKVTEDLKLDIDTN